MSITKETRRRIAGFSEDYVFTASDFEVESQNQSAVVKALNRMVKSGEISKLAKGKFYKPRIQGAYISIERRLYFSSSLFAYRPSQFVEELSSVLPMHALRLACHTGSLPSTQR